MAIQNLDMVEEQDAEGVVSSYAEASTLTRLFGGSARVKIIDVFLGKHYTELTVEEVAELADVHITTVHRNLQDIIETGLIEESGKQGNAQLYRLNKNSPISKILGRVRDELMVHSDRVPITSSSRSKTRLMAGFMSPDEIQESLEAWIEQDEEISNAEDVPDPSDLPAVKPVPPAARPHAGG